MSKYKVAYYIRVSTGEQSKGYSLEGQKSTLDDWVKDMEWRWVKTYYDEESAKEIYNRQGRYRHFLGAEEIIEFPDSTRYVVSNQWGKGNLEKFLSQARKLGCEIGEIS